MLIIDPDGFEFFDEHLFEAFVDGPPPSVKLDDMARKSLFRDIRLIDQFEARLCHYGQINLFLNVFDVIIIYGVWGGLGRWFFLDTPNIFSHLRQDTIHVVEGNLLLQGIFILVRCTVTNS